LEVYLVNARATKNLPGRKSDVQESQWLMKLHTYGLLRNFFSAVAGDSQDADILAAAPAMRREAYECGGPGGAALAGGDSGPRRERRGVARTQSCPPPIIFWNDSRNELMRLGPFS